MQSCYLEFYNLPEFEHVPPALMNEKWNVKMANKKSGQFMFEKHCASYFYT